MNNTKLYFFSGKMGSGKTTLAKKMSIELNAFYLSEDDILSDLFVDEIHGLEDYIRYSKKIKPMIEKLVNKLIMIHQRVVLDFPENTKNQRKWFKHMIQSTGSCHEFIYLKASDALCLKNIAKRSQNEPNRNKFDTEQMYYQVSKFFEAPTTEEGFNMKIKHVIDR